MRQLLESTLLAGSSPSSDGPWTSRGRNARAAAMQLLCPELDGGYRWSACANYLDASLRALDNGRKQPPSRARLLSDSDRLTIWQLANEARELWCELLAEIGADPDQRRWCAAISELVEARTGHKLLEPGRRSRLSPLASRLAA